MAKAISETESGKAIETNTLALTHNAFETLSVRASEGGFKEAHKKY
jgi:hypothetical protein